MRPDKAVFFSMSATQMVTIKATKPDYFNASPSTSRSLMTSPCADTAQAIVLLGTHSAHRCYLGSQNKVNLNLGTSHQA